MKLNKLVSTSVLSIALISASTFAHAKLTIVNNTDKDSSSVINGGMCSNKLPGGVTKAHSTNDVSDIVVGLACMGHSSDCKADVYMNDNCSGSPIASVVFDTSKGIQGVTMISNDYSITGSGFTIQLDTKSLS